MGEGGEGGGGGGGRGGEGREYYNIAWHSLVGGPRFRDQAALRPGSGNARSGRAPSRRQATSSSFRRAASSAAKASTPCGDQLIPWCLQRADTAQSLYFSTRVLAIHNPARCRCW